MPLAAIFNVSGDQLDETNLSRSFPNLESTAVAHQRAGSSDRSGVIGGFEHACRLGHPTRIINPVNAVSRNAVSRTNTNFCVGDTDNQPSVGQAAGSGARDDAWTKQLFL
jgi:hypothetical protein